MSKEAKHALGKLQKLSPSSWPETKSFIGIGHVEYGGPEWNKMLKILERHKLSEYKQETGHRLDTRTEYTISYCRSYSSDELDDFEYLRLCPTTEVGTQRRCRQTGAARLQRADSDIEHDVVAADLAAGLFVSERTKNLCDSSDLVGGAFLPTQAYVVHQPGETIGIRKDSDDKVSPWWELRSDIILMPMSESTLRTDGRGNLLPVSTTARFIQLAEQPNEFGLRFKDVEFTYKRNDFAPFEGFDIMWTYEKCSRELDYDRYFIISQRTRQLFVEHCIRANYIPIRLEDGE